jgi:hypothetical protein
MKINFNEGGLFLTFWHSPEFTRIYVGLPIPRWWAHWSKTWWHKPRMIEIASADWFRSAGEDL